MALSSDGRFVFLWSVSDKKENSKSIPRHIAIIMDGNGRWAKQRGKPRVFGHQSAIEAVRDTIEGGAEIGVEYMTLYTFSTENWRRPKREVELLMRLLVSTIHSELKTLMENDIRLMAIGDVEALPKTGKRELLAAIEKTKNNKRMTLILAISYSGRWEILKAVNDIADGVKKGWITPGEIDRETFEAYLTTKGIPDPELLIRTSGEYRISNFLLWQLAYAELVFVDKFWPDFRRQDLFDAIEEFGKRERRFGKISEQIG